MHTTIPSTERVAVRRTARRADVQGLRAVAVALIVLSTLDVSVVPGGFVGIDVFLTLTGFLVTASLLLEANDRRGIDVLRFYARRARRLLPLATLVLLATLVATYFLIDDNDRVGGIASESLWAAGLVANWKYVRNGVGYFDITPTSPVQHFWAISLGEQFFVLWPILLVLILFLGARRRSFQRTYVHRPSGRRVVLLGLVVFLLAAGSLALARTSAEAGGVAYFSTATRLWELAVGALLALAARRLRSLPDPVKAALSWVGLAGIIAAALLLDREDAFPGTPALLPVLATLLVLAGGIDGPGYGADGLLSLLPLRWLGDRAYGIYLWHLPVLVLAAAYVKRELSLGQASIVMVGVLVLAAITYSFYERPLRSGPPFNRGRLALILWPASIAAVTVVVLVSLDAVSAAPPVVASPPSTTAPTPTASTTPSTTTPPPPGQSISDGIVSTLELADGGDPVSSRVLNKLGGLAADTWTDDAPCISAFGSTTSDVCHYGPKDADQTMVIFGDEHAAMWIPTLRQVAVDNGWTFYYFVKAQCTASGGRLLDAVRQNREDECDSWRDWAIGQITDLAPDLTLVADNQTVTLTGEGDDRLSQDEQNTAWEAGMLDTLQTLGKSLPRVVAFSAVPRGPDPVVCLDADNVQIADCTFLYGRGTKSRDTGTQRAVATSNTGFLDVTPLLCSEDRCPPFNTTDLIYSAPGQLTRSYAVKLAPAVADALDIG